MTHSNKVREFLLPLTVRHAAERSAFYRARFDGLSEDIQSLTDLKKLPLLRKADLVEFVDEIRTFRQYPDYLMYTSGTTGKPLEVPVLLDEIRSFDQLLLPLIKERFGDPPLSLVVLRVGHGSHVLTPSIPAVPCHINYGLDQLVEMLGSTHWLDGSRVRVKNLEANVLNIREITSGFLQQGIDPRKFELETLFLSGWYIPQWERSFLKKTWGVKAVLDRYGVTEVNGDAKWCEVCEHYHFDFTVIPELIDPDTELPTTDNIGLMVLTGLYPFNLAMPKLRYLVTDLVEMRPTGCGCPELGLRFLSRLQDAVLAPPGSASHYRLFTSDVAEVLAPLPDVARKVKTGFLKFKLSTTAEFQARLEVELTYPPALFPSRVREIEDLILRGLEARAPNLGTMELVFLRPNQLMQVTKV
jgi:phenylacetate-coenzyme A ligase PaaK-like adenylate-forming protein